MPSPEASGHPSDKPADAPPSGAALSDKARLKLQKQLQTQENKLQKLLAKSGEIGDIKELRKVIEKETLFKPALACLKKQAEIAEESKGAIDPTSFLEKAKRLEALEKVFVKNLANGNGPAAVASAVQKQFAEALSLSETAEQQSAPSSDATVDITPAPVLSPEPAKTAEVSPKPVVETESLQELTELRRAVLAEEKAKVQAQLGAVSANEKQAGEETPPVPTAAPAVTKREEQTPPTASGPAAADSEKAKPAQKQNGNGNGNRVRQTTLERVQQEAKGFEQGISIALNPALKKEEQPKAAAEPPKKTEAAEQTGGATKAPEQSPRSEQVDAKKAGEEPPKVEKVSPRKQTEREAPPDALRRIMRDVEKSGSLTRKREGRDVVVRGAKMAKEIGRLARIFESEEFNAKNAAERERTIRESVELLTTNERRRRDLLSVFEQKGWLTKSGKGELPAQKEEAEKKASPAPPKPPDTPTAKMEQPKTLEPEKEKSAAALLHRVLTDVARVPEGETIPRRMPDGSIRGIPAKEMAAGIQKLIAGYETLEFPKKSLKERRDSVLHDIDNITSHPLLRADLEHAFAAKGWLPHVAEPVKTAMETKAAEPKPPVETEPKPAEPAAATERPVAAEPASSPAPTPAPTPIETAQSTSASPPKDAPATLAGNPPPKESAPASPPSTPPPAVEKTPVPEPGAKAGPSLAELLRARIRGGPASAKAEAAKPLVEKTAPSPAALPPTEKASSIPPVVSAEKLAASEPPKTRPLPAELLRERARGGARKEAVPVPPQPSASSPASRIAPRVETAPVPEPTEIPPAPSRGGGERSDLSPDARSDLKELPKPESDATEAGAETQTESVVLFEKVSRFFPPSEFGKVRYKFVMEVFNEKTLPKEKAFDHYLELNKAEFLQHLPRTAEYYAEYAKRFAAFLDAIRKEGTQNQAIVLRYAPFVKLAERLSRMAKESEVNVRQFMKGTGALREAAGSIIHAKEGGLEFLESYLRDAEKLLAEATTSGAEKPTGTEEAVVKKMEPPKQEGGATGAESAPRGSAIEQKKTLTFENLAAWSKEDLAKLATAVPDDAVWATALQGTTANALEKAVQAALPPERVDNFALEILTVPIKDKKEIEAKQQLIMAEAQKMHDKKSGT